MQINTLITNLKLDGIETYLVIDGHNVMTNYLLKPASGSNFQSVFELLTGHSETKRIIFMVSATNEEYGTKQVYVQEDILKFLNSQQITYEYRLTNMTKVLRACAQGTNKSVPEDIREEQN